MVEPGRKVPKDYECPFDRMLYEVATTLDPFFHSVGFTANSITFLSIVFEILSLRALANRSSMFAAYNMIGYFFDCMDGYFARKHNQVSRFGDMLDHVSDIVYYIGFIVIILMVYQPFEQVVILSTTSLLFFLAMSHLSCQELVYNKPEESSTLGIIPKVCTKENVHHVIPFSRFFGTGTLFVAMSSLVYYFVSR